jgi:heme A synthase
MRFSKTNTLLLLAVHALFSGILVAQNDAAPIYPTDPHPAEAPNTEQDRAPEGMNQNTGQN